jgi:AbrB family looped-hinge helix DNA binding protein
MAIAHSRLTAQGQISIPAEVRRRLGLGPGSILEWDEAGETIVVRKAGKYSVADLHAAAFPDGIPERRSLDELKEGIQQHIRDKHARR